MIMIVIIIDPRSTPWCSPRRAVRKSNPKQPPMIIMIIIVLLLIIIIIMIIMIMIIIIIMIIIMGHVRGVHLVLTKVDCPLLLSSL